MAEPERQPPQRVGVREFRTKLSGFLRQARLGRSFRVTSHDQVVAQIRPPSKTERPCRKAGRLQGKIWMAADFDTLPVGVLAAIEGEDD